MIKETLGPTTAALLLSGEMTDEVAEGLAASLSKLRVRYCYDRVELELASPGGFLTALSRCVAALDEARAGGMRVDTRVRTRAASAAALLASFGDGREATPTAQLLYHNVRTNAEGAVTAPVATILSASLADSDRSLAHALAARARMPGTKARRPHRFKVAEFAASDWLVVERLAGGDGGRGERLRTLRRRVADAAGAPDEKPLAALYFELLALNAWISARLAVELLLIDRVADPARSEDRRSQAASGGLAVPEWRTLYPNGGTVPRAALCRHALVLGETGSGKTVSGILPLVSAALRQDSPVGCLLVIDPKREIAEEAVRLAGGDALTIDPGSGDGVPRIDLMAGPRSPAEDLAAGRVETAARGILIRAASLDPLSPARALTGEAATHRDAYWPQQGSRLALSALSLSLALSERRALAFGDRTRAAALRGLPADLRRACAAPGVEAGWLVEDPGVAAAAAEARRRLIRGGTPVGNVLAEFERAVGRTDLHRGSPAFRDEFDELARQCWRALETDPEYAAPEPDPQLPLPLGTAEESDESPWFDYVRRSDAGERQAKEAERRRRGECAGGGGDGGGGGGGCDAVRPRRGGVREGQCVGRRRAAADGPFRPRRRPVPARSTWIRTMTGSASWLPETTSRPPRSPRACSPCWKGARWVPSLRTSPASGSRWRVRGTQRTTRAFSRLPSRSSRRSLTRCRGRTLFFGCEPGFKAGAGDALDFTADVAARGRRAVHVVRPEPGREGRGAVRAGAEGQLFSRPC